MRHQLLVAVRASGRSAVSMTPTSRCLAVAPAQTVAQVGAEALTLAAASAKASWIATSALPSRFLGFARRARVGDDARDRILQRPRPAFEQRDDVVVALRHLAPVQAGQQRHRLLDVGLRQHEQVVTVAEQVVEALRDVARHLDVLRLVAADRNPVRIEQQDVGRHQDRVAVQPHRDAGVRILAGLEVGVERGLVGVGAVHLPLGGDAGQQPGQFGRLGDVALAIEAHPLRIESGGQPGGGDLEPRALDAHRIVALDQRVVVGQEEEALDIRLAAGRDGRTDRADIVAQVRACRWS